MWLYSWSLYDSVRFTQVESIGSVSATNAVIIQSWQLAWLQLKVILPMLVCSGQ